MVKRKSGRMTWEKIQVWGEAVDGAALLGELREVFRRYVVLPKWGTEMFALWTVHTYAWQLRDVTTYVGVSSPEKRCGKTTLLGVLTELAHRPVPASNISPPALFRVIEEAAPTLLIDEADTFLQGNEEMRGILNAGYSRKTAYVVRVANEKMNKLQGLPGYKVGEHPHPGPLLVKGEGEDAGTARGSAYPTRDEGATEARPTKEGGAVGTPRPGGLEDRWENGNYGNNEGSRLARFSCWCPKVMAAIGRLPETLADRCIVMTMERKGVLEVCERLKDLDGSALRSKCARFVMDHAQEIGAARPQAAKGLNDRAADIWEPLLVLADLAGGEWPKLARDAAMALSDGIGKSNVLGMLLTRIWAVFRERGAERMFSRRLVEELNRYPDRPWAKRPKGQGIDELWLGRRLSRYGVRSKTIWIDGAAAKGYLMSDLEPVFRRYVTAADLEELREEPQESTNSQVPSTREAPITNHQKAAKDHASSTEGQAPGANRTEEKIGNSEEQKVSLARPWRRIDGL